MQALGAAERPGLDQIDELRAAFAAEDDRRRVFGLGRDVADPALEIGAAAVAAERHLLADLETGERRLGHEEADLEVPRRQQRDDRRAGRDELALLVERVEHERRRGARPGAGPTATAPARARRRPADRRLGRADLVLARGQMHGVELGLELRDARLVAVEVGLRRIERLLGGRARGVEPLLAREAHLGQSELRLGLALLRRDLVDLGRPLALGQVIELGLGLAQTRLAWSRAAVSAVQSSSNRRSPALTWSPRLTARRVKVPEPTTPTRTYSPST